MRNLLCDWCNRNIPSSKDVKRRYNIFCSRDCYLAFRERNLNHYCKVIKKFNIASVKHRFSDFPELRVLPEIKKTTNDKEIFYVKV